eukprot:scaffold2471_cov155-Cylindrotheca_fusiformis.AAC.3
MMWMPFVFLLLLSLPSAASGNAPESKSSNATLKLSKKTKAPSSTKGTKLSTKGPKSTKKTTKLSKRGGTVVPPVTVSAAPSASAAPSGMATAAPSATASLSPTAAVLLSIGKVNFDDIDKGDFVGDYKGLKWSNLQVVEISPAPPSPPRIALATSTVVWIESGPGEIFSLVSVDVIGKDVAEPITVRGFDNNGDLVATKGIDATPGGYQTFDLTEFANVKMKDRNNQGWRTRCASLTVLYRWPVIIPLDVSVIAGSEYMRHFKAAWKAWAVLV